MILNVLGDTGVGYFKAHGSSVGAHFDWNKFEPDSAHAWKKKGEVRSYKTGNGKYITYVESWVGRGVDFHWEGECFDEIESHGGKYVTTWCRP